MDLWWRFLEWFSERYEKKVARAEQRKLALAKKYADRHPRAISKVALSDNGPPRAIGDIRIKMGECQMPTCECKEHNKVLSIGSHEVCKCGHVQMLHIEQE